MDYYDAQSLEKFLSEKKTQLSAEVFDKLLSENLALIEQMKDDLQDSIDQENGGGMMSPGIYMAAYLYEKKKETMGSFDKLDELLKTANEFKERALKEAEENKIRIENVPITKEKSEKQKTKRRPKQLDEYIGSTAPDALIEGVLGLLSSHFNKKQPQEIAKIICTQVKEGVFIMPSRGFKPFIRLLAPEKIGEREFDNIYKKKNNEYNKQKD